MGRGELVKRDDTVFVRQQTRYSPSADSAPTTGHRFAIISVDDRRYGTGGLRPDDGVFAPESVYKAIFRRVTFPTSAVTS